jgi:hypothetical protein
MATRTIQAGSRFARYAWTIFVGLGALMILNGVGDMFRATTNLNSENALNELLIGLFGVAIAVYGLRRGERWAWYAMLLWPLWLIAQNGRAISGAYMTGEASSILTSTLLLLAGPVFLILIVAALVLAYRAVFSNHG